MKINVYLSNNTRDSGFYEEHGKFFNKTQAIAAFGDGGYTLAGSFTIEDRPEVPIADILAAAHIRTQNANDLLWNPTQPCRSTQVGDIFEIDGAVFITARGFSFADVTNPDGQWARLYWAETHRRLRFFFHDASAAVEFKLRFC